MNLLQPSTNLQQQYKYLTFQLKQYSQNYIRTYIKSKLGSCKKIMNIKVNKEERKIRKIDFGQHIVGYRFGPYRNQQHPASAYPTPPNTDYRYTRPSTVRSQTKLYHHTRSRPLLDDQDEGQIEEINFQEPMDQNQALAQQQEKHLQFIRSYQAWLNDNYQQAYQTSRIHNSFPLKKHKHKQQNKETPKLAWQAKSYKEWNLFPLRSQSSLKRKKLKPQKETPTNINHKSQGQLKINLLKTFKKVDAREPRKSCQPKQTIRPATALLRNFSNPKILSSQNKPLITGTKIVLH